MKYAARYIGLLAMLSSVTSVSRAAVPINSWNLEPSSNSCLISRSYGSPQSSTLVGLKAMPEGDGIQLAIVRPAYRMEVDQNPVELVAGGAVIRTTALSYPAGGRDRRSANLINLSADQAALLRKATTLSIFVTASTHEDFDFSAMSDAWANLDSCKMRLRDAWNVENPVGRIATPAKAIVPLRSLFSPNDYPLEQLEKNESGAVVVQLLIDEAGAVKDCTIAQPSGIAIFDLRSCGIIMKGAKFKPATDDRGRPVKSSTTQEIHWLAS